MKEMLAHWQACYSWDCGRKSSNFNFLVKHFRKLFSPTEVTNLKACIKNLERVILEKDFTDSSKLEYYNKMKKMIHQKHLFDISK